MATFFRRCASCPHLIDRRRNRHLNCPSCRSRRYRGKDPMRYAYRNLKTNSKRRGIVFSLTFEEFTKFARATNYIKRKGLSFDSYSIDRIDNMRGYTPDNIHILTMSDNARKSTKKVEFDIESYERTGEFRMRVHRLPDPSPGEEAW